jgi:DNA-binding beta-propeller fold protein YncE
VGDGDSEFTEQHGIGFDSLHHIYVADTGNMRIQVFSPNGEFLSKWGSMGAGADQFLMPQDIAIDPQDNLYIIDIGDAHPEISYIGNFLEENRDLTQTSCDDTETIG